MKRKIIDVYRGVLFNGNKFRKLAENDDGKIKMTTSLKNHYTELSNIFMQIAELMEDTEEINPSEKMTMGQAIKKVYKRYIKGQHMAGHTISATYGRAYDEEITKYSYSPIDKDLTDNGKISKRTRAGQDKENKTGQPLKRN